MPVSVEQLENAPIANGDQPLVKGGIGQCGAILECIVADGGDASRDTDAC